MFEIKTEEALFRFSFIERIEEPEDRRQDLIMCWLEVEGSGVKLQCQCEFSLYDLEELRNKLASFQKSISDNQLPSPIVYTPRVSTFQCEISQAADADIIGFNFRVTPDILTRWTLTGGTVIDQSYFPHLISGINSILTN